MKVLEDRVGRPLRPCAARLTSTELTGTVRLGSNEEVDPAKMATLLGRFKRTHPGATIEFVFDHTEHLTAQIDQGAIDVATIQVDDDRLRTTDTVLWTDELRWVTGCETQIDRNAVVPLITFGEHCVYRAVSEPVLESAGIDHTVTYSSSSIGGVCASLVAGLGAPGGNPPDRADRPGRHTAVTSALVEAISAELLDPIVSAMAG